MKKTLTNNLPFQPILKMKTTLCTYITVLCVALATNEQDGSNQSILLIYRLGDSSTDGLKLLRFYTIKHFVLLKIILELRRCPEQRSYLFCDVCVVIIKYSNNINMRSIHDMLLQKKALDYFLINRRDSGKKYSQFKTLF